MSAPFRISGRHILSTYYKSLRYLRSSANHFFKTAELQLGPAFTLPMWMSIEQTVSDRPLTFYGFPTSWVYGVGSFGVGALAVLRRRRRF